MCIRDRNLGFCFDRLNSEFIASMILKPILCLLFVLFGPGFPKPTSKSINIYFLSGVFLSEAVFFSADCFLSVAASLPLSSFLEASPSLPPVVASAPSAEAS